MDLYRIIEELVEERNRIQRIIESLETMNEAPVKPKPAPRAPKGRNAMDEKARKAVSQRMKLYWAKRRAAGASAESE